MGDTLLIDEVTTRLQSTIPFTRAWEAVQTCRYLASFDPSAPQYTDKVYVTNREPTIVYPMLQVPDMEMNPQFHPLRSNAQGNCGYGSSVLAGKEPLLVCHLRDRSQPQRIHLSQSISEHHRTYPRLLLYSD